MPSTRAVFATCGLILGVVLMVPSISRPCLLDSKERAIIDLVAEEYNLDWEQSILLYALRRHEAGGPGLEFGVMTPRARRYKDGKRSLVIQARHAAGTIKKRWKGSVAKFGKRFHNGTKESNADWVMCVSCYLEIYKRRYPKYLK